MAFSLFNKDRCTITDDLFLEISWEDGRGPEDDSELLAIIEGLDHLYDYSQPISKSLPYLTFHQAELLFGELKQMYGQFQLKKVAIAHLEGKNVVTEGEVYASPFLITEDYENLLLPLIQAILTRSEFANYSYQEKREYFENQIYPVYKQSMGLSDSSLPLFPAEGEMAVISKLNHPSHDLKVGGQTAVVPPITQKQSVSLKKIYLFLGLLGVLTVVNIVGVFFAFAQLSNQSEKVNFLYQEQKNTQFIISTKNEVDVFSRYFLPSYYSGKKENLVDFLSEGDAKFTKPKEGILQSVILEKLNYDSETQKYTVSYILSVKKGDKSSSVRLTFDVKASDSSKYGFVVETEPKESNYLKN
ncbi:hypothetical protein MK435_02445 [Streptococcus oralis]|uniref:hypothetical protein n=1 Tax=Streptococcus oralis TaxID=1303 RepID=UPI0020C93277|nr:hypothetical protein [Streptococcus oralis]MCP9125463.1 hypothetical protein [Streptococcus oralis]MCY7109733.1 hypothetical protein [Streptococcus oralis]